MKGRISVVLPAYNEAHCIAHSIESVRQQFSLICKDLEIIVVDDGSTDGTRTAAGSAADSQTKVVGYGENMGKGHALREGFNCVTGEFSFLLDSDMEIGARNLSQYVIALRSVDIVVGSKRHPLSVVETPAIRKFLSAGFNVLERILTGVSVSDTQAGLKCAKSKTLYRVLPLLSVKKYAFDAELLAVATLLDFRIRELPVRIQLKATFSIREVLRMVIDLLGIFYRLRLRKWYQHNVAKMSETYTPIISW